MIIDIDKGLQVFENLRVYEVDIREVHKIHKKYGTVISTFIQRIQLRATYSNVDDTRLVDYIDIKLIQVNDKKKVKDLYYFLQTKTDKFLLHVDKFTPDKLVKAFK